MTIEELVRDIHAVPFSKSKTKKLLADFKEITYMEGERAGIKRGGEIALETIRHLNWNNYKPLER